MTHTCDRIQTIAEYFTGSAVALNSMKLGVDSLRGEAQQWFQVRTVLGIRGYMTAEEAECALKQIMTNP